MLDFCFLFHFDVFSFLLPVHFLWSKASFLCQRLRGGWHLQDISAKHLRHLVISGKRESSGKAEIVNVSEKGDEIEPMFVWPSPLNQPCLRCSNLSSFLSQQSLSLESALVSPSQQVQPLLSACGTASDERDGSFQGHWWHHSWPNVGAQGRGWRSYGCWAAWLLMLLWGHSNVFTTIYTLEVNSGTLSAA